MCSEHVLPFGVFMKDCHRDLNNFTFWCSSLAAPTQLYQDDVMWHLPMWRNKLRYKGERAQADLGREAGHTDDERHHPV